MSDHGEEGGHDHGGSDHSHDHGSGNRRALAIALAINTVFFVVEIVGAYYADSLTLFADATHMLTDSASIALGLFAAWVATRPADEKRTFGYSRAEILGALLNGLFLLAVVVYIGYEAAMRFQEPRMVKPVPVIVIGVVGLAANLAAAYVLTGGRDNLNVEGVFLHLLADAAGSVAAIALGVALLFTDLLWLDPAFSVLIALLVLYSAKDLLRESVNILMQGAPASVDVQGVAEALLAVDGVTEVHDVHVWAISSDRHACSVHLVVTGAADHDAVLETAREVLGERFDVGHATVQIERPDGSCETEDFDCYTAEAV